MKHHARVLLAGALTLGLAATACSENVGGGDDDDTRAERELAEILVDYEGVAPTPAAEVEGASEGGNITVLKNQDFTFLDPQQIYVSDALTYSNLFHRRLTNYIQREDGSMTLVGDLATNAGVTEDEGRTWTYTLREGISFEDGTPITSADVAYGLARSFSDYGVQGPQFFQNAADPTRLEDPEAGYQGPYDGELLPPGVTTPDDQTIVFEFEEPFPGLPYVLAFPTSTPVPQDQDTEQNYDHEWVASGPYKRAEYEPDVSLVLERNENWDPNSDPIRNQYPDTITFEMGVEADPQTERLRAAAGDDRFALMDNNVSPELIATVQNDAELMERVEAKPNIFVFYIWINTTRVTDLDVRRALNYAFDRDAYIKAVGGYAVADPATTIMAPIVPGYKEYDAFPEAGADAPGGPHTGNPEMAMELLEGKDVPTLKYCTSNTETSQEVAAVLEAMFAEVDVEVATEFIDAANYFPTVSSRSNDCDLMSSGWGQDYPDGETVIGTIMDGAQIVEEGNFNYSYFSDPEIEAEIAELRREVDRGAIADRYGELDEKIMTEHAPLIPGRYGRDFQIAGPNVGNTYLGPAWNSWALENAYVIPEE